MEAQYIGSFLVRPARMDQDRYGRKQRVERDGWPLVALATHERGQTVWPMPAG